MARQLYRLVCPALFLFVCGCGGGPQFAEVEGTVTQGGKPLQNVRVEFWPDGDGPKSTGTTDEQGRFVLKSEDGKTAGAVVGPHKVILKDLNTYGDKFLGRKAENMPPPKDLPKPRFAKSYTEVQSAISKSVSGGNKNTIDIEVK